MHAYQEAWSSPWLTNTRLSLGMGVLFFSLLFWLVSITMFQVH